MTYDFTTPMDRSGTGSLKWDKYRDRDILPFWVADMDFVSPPEVLRALHARVDHGVFGYTLPYEEARSEVCAYLQRVHHWDVAPEHLVFLPGLVPALNLLCRMLDHTEDAVMTTVPVYPPFLSAPLWQDRKRITVPMQGGEGEWRFDIEAMDAAVTPQTRMFILCSPYNPLGRVFRPKEIQEVVDFCERNNLLLISDEIHCDLVLDPDVAHQTTARIAPEVKDRLITLMAPSKTYNLPGLACACAVIQNDALRQRFQNSLRGIITEINVFGYVGCIAAYRHGEPWRLELLKVLRANRDLLYEFIGRELPGIKLQPMQATYLAWLDVRGLNLENPVAFFEEQGVGLSNGADFGAPGFLRLNFGCPRAMLQEGLERMAAALR